MHRLLATLPLLLLSNFFCLAGETVEKGPVPDWVEVAEGDFPEGKAAEDGSVRYLLVDLQVHGEEKASYHAYVTQIVTEAGVEEFSQISEDFQPEYQTLVWHSLEVVRGGVVQDRLESAKFEVIRREEGLDMQLYDGELTAHVILDDIRPGDTVSYSFTVKGENPIFAGHVNERMQGAFGVPVERVRRRFLWDPEVRTVAWQALGGGLEISEKTLEGGLRCISYDAAPVARWETEQDTPDWFIDYPYLEISDFKDWGEFGGWAYGIYRSSDPLPAELAEVCEGIRAEGGTPAEQVVKVLRWVQGNIRYLGSFFGEHTHAPHALAEIAGRRFGDCKDKGITTVAMLRHMGFQADPALVDTDVRGRIMENLPGYGLFDHLIVRLVLDGKPYWLDPTRAFQQGNLAGNYSPDYGFAFVVEDGADGLTVASSSGVEQCRTDLKESFTIPDMEGNATLEVETVAQGYDADILRRRFATDGRAVLETDYRDFYAQDYPEIELDGALEFSDDPLANRITVKEHYRITGFWTKQKADEGGEELLGEFYARSIGSYLSEPDGRKRKAPYHLSHPVHIRHAISVKLPEAWDLEDERSQSSLPSVRCSYRADVSSRSFKLFHEYKSLADAVEPGDFPKYKAAIKEAEDNLYYALSYPLNGTAGRTTPDADGEAKSYALMGFMVGFGLVCGLGLAAGLYFWSPPARVVAPGAPRGLSGWLTFPVLGCFAQPAMAMVSLSTYLGSIGVDGFTLFDGRAGQAGWVVYFCAGVFLEGFFFPLFIFLLMMLLRRRTNFPYVYIGILFLHLCKAFLVLVLASVMDSSSAAIPNPLVIMGGTVWTLVWSLYMILSKRVKATFTRGRKNPPALPKPPPLPVFQNQTNSADGIQSALLISHPLP